MATFTVNGQSFSSADFYSDFKLAETITVGGVQLPRWAGLHYAGALAVAAIGPSYAAASTTPLTVGAGVHDLVVTGGSLLSAGCWVEVFSAADPAVAMVGPVTAADPAAGTLQVTVPAGGASGSGAHGDWVIRLSGRRGIQGETGDTGPQGPQGDIGGRWWAVVGTPGAGLGTDGDMALDASGGPTHGTVWSKDGGAWTESGNIAGPPDTPLSDATPLAPGAAAPGTGTAAARDDHVHPMPSAAAVGAVPAGAVGAPDGVAALGPDGQVIASQLPDNLGDVAAVSANISGNVSVGGNLHVAGSTVTVDAQTVQVADHVMILNHGETGVGVTAGAAGLEIDRGTLAAYRLVFREADDTFVIGESGGEQPVATRQDTPTANAVPFWNAAANRLDSVPALTWDGAALTLPAAIAYDQASFKVSAASVGASATIALADGEVQALTLTANTVVTLPDPPAGRGYAITLKLIQDGPASRTPSFQKADATAARWLGGAAPTWQTAAGAIDVVVLTHDGTDLIAAHAGGVA